MNKELLLQLADGLDTIDTKEFNIIDIAYSKDPLDYRRLSTDCGSVGCAMGWTPTILKDVEDLYLERQIPKSNYYNLRYKDYYNFEAMGKLFDITEDEVNELCLGSGYPGIDHVTPKHVADKIRSLVAQ